MKIFIKILCVVLALSSIAVFAGCGEDNSKSSSDPSVEQNDKDSLSDDKSGNSGADQADLSKLHAINYEGDDFAGAWQIVDGEGSQFKSFVYVFDGNKKAYLIVGTNGYVENYSVENKDDGSGNIVSTITAQMMFGINGTYTYEFSDDKNELTLTNIKTKKTTKLKKLATFSYVPIPDPDPVIDEDLLGAWKDKNGEYYYFDKSGIMYENYGVSFYFAKYSAKDGQITYTYTSNKEETKTFKYSVDGDTLTLDGAPYERIPVSELK